ncbi:hypothetical protein ACS0TY_020243 [Phlomoides rotata]
MIFLIHGKDQNEVYADFVRPVVWNDWSSHNVLAVGLGNCVYLWHASSSKVVKLCDLGYDDNVCEVLDKGISKPSAYTNNSCLNLRPLPPPIHYQI